MSTLVETLVAAGWTAESFDNDPSAVTENDQVEIRVVTDADGDTFLLLGDLDSEAIQLWTVDGGSPADVFLTHQPELSRETVPAMMRALIEAGCSLTGGSGVEVDSSQLDGLDRLPQFRDAFWQVVPFEGRSIARYEGSEVDVEIVEVSDDDWELILSRDDDFEDVYALTASPEAATALIENANEITTSTRDALPAALREAGITVEQVEV